MAASGLTLIVGAAGLVWAAITWRGAHNNPTRRFGIMWLAIAWVAGVAGLFAVAAGLDLSPILALMAVAVGIPVLVLLGLILGIFYLIRAGNVDEMIAGEGLLAHWKYTPNEWRRFAEGEQRTRGKELKLSLLLAAVVMVLYVAVSPFLDIGMEGLSSTEVALIVCAFMSIFLLGLGLVGLVLTDPRRGGPGEAYIARNGILVHGSVLVWSLGIRLDGVQITPGDPALLEFAYSAQTRYGVVAHTVRVPIPDGKLDEAERIVEELMPSTERTFKCPHAALLPRWDSAADMGSEERASHYVCEACGQKFSPPQASRVRQGLLANEPPSAEDVEAQAARDAAYAATFVQGCPHTTLLPRWDSPADMGHTDRATRFICEACQEAFSPEQAASIRHAAPAVRR